MAIWSVGLFLVAVAGTAVLADPRFTFPEIAREQSDLRIVSGWEAELGQIPYQLSLRMVSPVGGVSACGGTIIHPEWGLTAAHCTAGRLSFVVRAGTVNLTQPSLIFETTRFYNYPEYDESITSVVQPHDIGLLAFGRRIEFNAYIQPIRLQNSAAKDANYHNQISVASGWGRTWTGGVSPENMNWVFLTLISNEACHAAYPTSTIIVPSTICASHYNVTSQSTCQGDSGGPLTTIDLDGVVSQVGVTSFVSGTGCHTDVPAGFIRPGFYHAWFTEVSGINFDWEYEPSTPAPEPTTTDAPETEEPTTTGAPETEEPTTTGAPETEEPTTTGAPETEAPTTTGAPETEEPTTTGAPETEEPTTTGAPETEEPTTVEEPDVSEELY